MSNLVPFRLPSEAVTLHDDRPVTTSLVVAQVFHRRHDNVLQAIQRLECSPEFRRLNFQATFRAVPGPNGSVRQERLVEMTRDGFAFLGFGFTGREAARFKEGFIAAFNALEAEARTRGQLPPEHVAHLRERLVAVLDRAARLEQAAERANPRWAVIRKCYAAGLDNAQTGRVLKVSENTVRREKTRMTACGLLGCQPAPSPRELSHA